jgi:futalosine hydrolase
MYPIALVCAVELEATPLLGRLAQATGATVGSRPAHFGRLEDRAIVVLIGGMGKTNAAHALTALLERTPVRGIIGFGVAGAYPGSGLQVGDLCLASSQHYGDEGVETPTGWISCEGIGIPLAEANGARFFNDFPVDQPGLRRGAAVVSSEQGRLTVGPFVTVSSCSGTTERGASLERRFGAVCETMEGAAYAHIAALYGLPYLELRGISNLVEDRDLASWQLAKAANAVAEALPALVRTWSPPSLEAVPSR